MEYQSEIKEKLRNSRFLDGVIPTQASQNLKLHDRFRLDLPSSSYADFHEEIIKDGDDPPPKFYKASEDDELVKYMSKLPSYLARGENLKEKALSVGVLDWGRLEKWQHNLRHDHVFSPSSSNTSSFFSNDGSSATHSSSVQSCSPSSQQMRRPTLQSHLKASPQMGFSQSMQSFEGNDGKCQDISFSKSDTLNAHNFFSKAGKPFYTNQSEATFDRSMEKDSMLKILGQIEAVSHLENFEDPSNSNRKIAKSSSLVPPHAHTTPCELEKDKHARVTQSTSVDEQTIELLSGSIGKRSAKERSRSIPLRRLLDPLRKQMTAESSAPHAMKVKLDMKNCKSINVKEPFQTEKEDESHAMQALLQVGTKHGLPLFTFAVDNNDGILAATMKKLDTSKSDEYSYLYTFFAIHEIKRKSWLKRGGKGRDYIPNVIAQMKVSDIPFSSLIKLKPKDCFRMREFVLFSVGPKQESDLNLNFYPKHELAAFVLKTPNKLTFVGNQDHLNTTTVILPSGAHSVSSKGEPSSLIERWISSGACDCGGWDLGCKLRVLGDANQFNKKSSLSTNCSATKPFELFDQDLANQPVFSLASFRDGVYTATFNSSISHLQAFSICIAALDSRKLAWLSDSSDSLQVII